MPFGLIWAVGCNVWAAQRVGPWPSPGVVLEGLWLPLARLLAVRLLISYMMVV